MLSALNFSSQAAAALRSYPFPNAPISRVLNRWIADLLDKAEVFVLPDGGRILDRDKPKPEVPGLIFKPPFPVVALEYVTTDDRNNHPFYNCVPCPKRIALAWDSTAYTPPSIQLAGFADTIEPGVSIISIFYSQSAGLWFCNLGAGHLPYEGEWLETGELAPFQKAIAEHSPIINKAKGFTSRFIPLMIEQLCAVERSTGSKEATLDAVQSDNHDEAVSYIDLCYALACRNVTAERCSASKIVNGVRRRPDLRDFHVLKIGDQHSGDGDPIVPGAGRRAHLRRGHIRRLGPDRITWVNQTMVSGSAPGFAAKRYSMKGAA